MFIKKIIILSGFLVVSCASSIKLDNETIPFKDLTEFDACFLIYRSALSFNMKDMLSDYMKFKEFECTKYEEVLKRGSVVKGSAPRNSKVHEVNKK